MHRWIVMNRAKNLNLLAFSTKFLELPRRYSIFYFVLPQNLSPHIWPCDSHELEEGNFFQCQKNGSIVFSNYAFDLFFENYGVFVIIKYNMDLLMVYLTYSAQANILLVEFEVKRFYVYFVRKTLLS